MADAEHRVSKQLEKLRAILGPTFPETSLGTKPEDSNMKQPTLGNSTQNSSSNQHVICPDALTEKEKNARARKQAERLTKQQRWANELKRAERYLGMRQSDTIDEPAADASWAELQAYHAQVAERFAKTKNPTPVDPLKPPPYPFHTEPIFFSIDVECYEHDNSKVTEIGLATLDTADLAALSPGRHGTRWHDKIRARHFRITEHAHLRNGTHVPDAADKFQFSKRGSEFISAADAPRFIASCFRPPYSKHHGPDADENHDTNTLPAAPAPRRHLVLLGHDINNDVRYLRKLGYNLDTMPSQDSTGSSPYARKSPSKFDTADLYRALHRTTNPPSLLGIISDYDMVAWNPHNAGNDAVYTLWALLAIVLQSASRELQDHDSDGRQW